MKTNKDVFKYIDMADGNTAVCWKWLGSLSGRDQRAYFSIGGKRKLAYRIVWELFFGDIPKDKVVMHKCDNQECCNPYHLELGTQSKNMQDMSARDRVGTPTIVVHACLKLVQEHKWTHAQVAELFGLAPTTVSAFVQGKRKAYK